MRIPVYHCKPGFVLGKSIAKTVGETIDLGHLIPAAAQGAVHIYLGH